MQSKVEVFQGLIQAYFQGGDHFSLFMWEHKQLPDISSFTYFTSQTNLPVIRTFIHSVPQAHSTVLLCNGDYICIVSLVKKEVKHFIIQQTSYRIICICI